MRVPICTLLLWCCAAPPLFAEPAAIAPESESLLDAAAEVLERVEQLRGIEVENLVQSDVVGRGDLRQMLVSEVAQTLSDQQSDAIDRLLTALGVLRADQDYLSLLLDLLEEQIAGFYDDGEGIFYILDDMPLELQLPVMAHELFHAVQDQAFDLTTLKGRSDIVTDFALARSALVEGDALAAMLLYSVDGALQLDQIPFIDTIAASTPSAAEASSVDVPEVLWQQLTFPYTGGLAFVLHLYRAGGWNAVNAAYLSPPISAEQVLHPERYVEGDAPTWLEYDAQTGTARRYLSDILGEFTWRGLLHQIAGDGLSDAAIARALDGWDGDRVDAWRFDDDPLRDRVTVLSVWDSNDDASQFAESVERLASSWASAAPAVEICAGSVGRRVIVESAGVAALVDLRGDLVALVLDRGGSTDARRAEVIEAVDAIWASYARYSYPDAIFDAAP